MNPINLLCFLAIDSSLFGFVDQINAARNSDQNKAGAQSDFHGVVGTGGFDDIAGFEHSHAIGIFNGDRGAAEHRKSGSGR